MIKPSFLAVVFAICACAVPHTTAGPREDTAGILRSIQVDRDTDALQAWLNAPGTDSLQAPPTRIALGDRQRFFFKANADLYLTAVHLDSQGVATVLLPSQLPNQVKGGVLTEFPPAPAEFHAQPPLGQESVFVFGTRRPVSLDELGLAAGDSGFAILDGDDAAALARRLKGVLESPERGGSARAELQYRIIGRPGVDYSVKDVVDFLTGPRARSVRSSRFGARVHFATNSAELTAESRQLLDVMGQALTEEPELARRRFVIAGHTDQVGSEESNLVLSKTRARSVYAYLADRWVIDPDRMEVAYYGETIPWELGSDPEALKLNRRVEFVFQRGR